uniref:Uncharacterized protein n=1 Tax=viral metagenome TaxID=1070528 RepID=A0A6C0BL99_9ZZZZ
MTIASYIALLEAITSNVRPAQGSWLGSFVRIDYDPKLDMSNNRLELSDVPHDRLGPLMRLGYPVAMVNESGRYVIYLRDNSHIMVAAQLLIVNTRTMFRDNVSSGRLYYNGCNGLINSVIVPRLIDCDAVGCGILEESMDELTGIINQSSPEMTLYECICRYPDSVKDIARILDYKHTDHYVEDLLNILDGINITHEGGEQLQQMIEIEYNSYLGRLRFFNIQKEDITEQVAECAKKLDLKSLEVKKIEGAQAVSCDYVDIIRDMRVEIFKRGVTQVFKQ